MNNTAKVVAATAVATVVLTNKFTSKKRARKAAPMPEYITFANDFGGTTTCRVDFLPSLMSILDHMK